MGTTVITGANRGIGLALCSVYKHAGETVVACCRRRSEPLTELGVDIIEGIDVAEPDVGKTLAARLAGQKVSNLINNAGVWGKARLGAIDYEDFDRVFATNALGPLRITEALLDNLGQGSKIGLITSRMGSIADNTSGSGYDYRMSKAALNMAGKSLAVDLAPRGVAVAVLHPGYVQTDMVGGRGDISAEEAAQRLFQRMAALTLENSGSFWHSNGQPLPW